MLTSTIATMIKIFREEDGATAIEYGLIAALISIIAIPGMLVLGPKISAAFENIASHM